MHETESSAGTGASAAVSHPGSRRSYLERRRSQSAWEGNRRA
ncbi:hypothetical protein [Halobellus clavatus]|nr:hypothetical protein [Halobellus clavatus]